jgi:hypothetical protein
MVKLFKLTILLLTLLLHSCSCEYRLKQVKRKCGFTTDTVYKTLEVIVPKVQKDTIFHFSHSQKDTVIIKEGRLTMRYFYNTHDSTVYLSGKCDTVKIIKKIPQVINKYHSRAINWNWLLFIALLLIGAYFILPRLFKK